MPRLLDSADRFLERADRSLATGARWPLAVLAAALTIKVIYVLVSAGALYARAPIMDSKYFDQTAQEIASGRWSPREPFFMAPLYSYFLALVYSLAGRDFTLVRLLQAAAGAATVALTFVLGRRAFRPSAALAGAVLLMLYGAMTFYEGALTVEWMAALLNCIALFMLHPPHPSRTPGAVRYAAAGAVLGLSVLAGAGIVVFAAFVVGWTLFGERRPRRWVSASAFALCLGIVILPSLVQNHIADGVFAPVTSNAGVNFYIGNGAAANGMFAPIGGVDLLDDVTTRDFVESQQGREAGPARTTAYWLRRARAEMGSPARWIALIARKAAMFFNGYEAPEIESYDVQRRELAWLRALFVPFQVIVALGLLGMLLSARARDRHGLLLGYVLAFALAVIPFFVSGRHRAPVVPVCCLFAGHALVAAPSLLRSFRSAAALAVAATALFLATGSGIFRIDPRAVEFREQLSRARRLSALRSFAPALREADRAVALYPQEPEGYLQRAIVYRESGNEFKAVEDYRRALEIDAAQPAVHYDLAQALRRLGLREQAIREYRLAADYDSSMAQAYNNLGVTYRELREYEQAIAAFRKTIEIAPLYRRAYNNLGACYAESGRVDEAIATFIETTRRFPDYPTGYYNLAMAYASQKRPRPALEAMRKYATLNPSDLEARDLVRKLEIAALADSASADD